MATAFEANDVPEKGGKMAEKFATKGNVLLHFTEIG